MSLTSGTHLGPYEIVAPLGAGGMGEVYRARDRRLTERDLTSAGITLSPSVGNPETEPRFVGDFCAGTDLDALTLCGGFSTRAEEDS